MLKAAQEEVIEVAIAAEAGLGEKEGEFRPKTEFFSKMMATLYFPAHGGHTFVNEYQNNHHMGNAENEMAMHKLDIAQNFVFNSLCFPLHHAISGRDFSELRRNLAIVSKHSEELWEQQKAESLVYFSEDEFWTLGLLQYGASVDARDKDGLTPLHWASSMGRVLVAKILIYAGAPLNATALKGYTPLHFASLCCQTEVAKLLIENGANRNQVDWSGETPVDCSEHRPTLEILKRTQTKIPSLQQMAIRYVRRHRLDYQYLSQELKFQVSSYFLCNL